MKKTLSEMISALNKLFGSLQNEYDNVYFDIQLIHTCNERCIQVINSINNLDLDRKNPNYGVKKSISLSIVYDYELDFDNRINEICETLKNKHTTHSDILAF